MRLAVLTSLLVTVAATAAADGPVGRIVYGGITDEGMSVYIVNADGRRHAQLAKHGANPRWLPDGSGVIVGPRLV
ncbi:hypothetical protein HN937_06370, partial [Candidatus Poribacteria bacterium]|nr:hypothetical protein [Candidatus Poribacteria bacterium]